jgi:hypothetical protein
VEQQLITAIVVAFTFKILLQLQLNQVSSIVNLQKVVDRLIAANV